MSEQPKNFIPTFFQRLSSTYTHHVSFPILRGSASASQLYFLVSSGFQLDNGTGLSNSTRFYWFEDSLLVCFILTISSTIHYFKKIHRSSAFVLKSAIILFFMIWVFLCRFYGKFWNCMGAIAFTVNIPFRKKEKMALNLCFVPNCCLLYSFHSLIILLDRFIFSRPPP